MTTRDTVTVQVIEFTLEGTDEMEVDALMYAISRSARALSKKARYRRVALSESQQDISMDVES